MSRPTCETQGCRKPRSGERYCSDCEERIRRYFREQERAQR